MAWSNSNFSSSLSFREQFILRLSCLQHLAWSPLRPRDCLIPTPFFSSGEGPSCWIVSSLCWSCFLEGFEQVWSLTQFYFVDFSKSRISVKKCVQQTHNQGFASVVVDGVLRLEGCRVSLIALIFAYLACLIFNCLGPPWLTTPCTWLAFVIWQKVCPNFIIIVPQPTNQHGGDTPTDDFLRKVRAGQNGTPVRKVKTQDHQPTFHVSKLKKSGFNGFHIVKRTRKGHVPGIWSFQP